MGRPAGWMRALTGWAPMKSPGKPSLRRDVDRLFWREIARGVTSEEAGIAVGVSQAAGDPLVPRAWRYAECTREDCTLRTGPLDTVADVEHITAAWVHRYNTSRLMHRLDRRPPAEAEAEYQDRTRTGQQADHT